MPTYEYICEKCGHQFEEFQRMTDNPLTLCPQKSCGGSIRRMISSGAGFLLKGSGFYETDYRSDSYKKSAAADKPSSSSSETKTSETKSECSKTTETKTSSAPSSTAKKD